MLFSADHRRSLIPVVPFLVIYLGGLALFGLHRPCWHDECHFVDTIMGFEQQFTLSTLTHYNEMSMPLPFVLYAAWGKAFGDSLMVLRLFSLCITGVTLLSFQYLFFLTVRNRTVSFLLLLFLALNPYMAGAGVFVYTDMLMMLSLALFMTGIVRRNAPLLFFSAAAGLLCRQYFIFAVAAGILYFILSGTRNSGEDLPWRAPVGALLAATIPAAALFALWHGLNPDNADKSLYISGGPRFHPNSLTLYITLFSVYAFPLLAVYRKRFYRNPRILVCSLLCGLWYPLFPIVASAVALDVNKPTVGYFHRLLRRWPGERFEHWVFFVLFTLALPVCFRLGIDLIGGVRLRKVDLRVFLGLATFSFLAVMPFSYLHWEKYFLPLVPVLALYCATAPISSGSKPGRRNTAGLP